MSKHYNTVSGYYSLLTHHTNEVTNFYKKANTWLAEDAGAANLFFEGLANRYFQENFISFPRKWMVIIQAINYLSKKHLEYLDSYSKILDLLLKVEFGDLEHK